MCSVDWSDLGLTLVECIILKFYSFAEQLIFEFLKVWLWIWALISSLVSCISWYITGLLVCFVRIPEALVNVHSKAVTKWDRQRNDTRIIVNFV